MSLCLHCLVELRKAYDSVSREALWQVLKKYGVPPVAVMLSLIRSCHDDMTAVVRISGGNADKILLEMQGCTMAPVLFNLYFVVMVACWRSHCPKEAGITVRYRIGLVGTGLLKQG